MFPAAPSGRELAMILRAWHVWGLLAVLIGVSVLSAKSPELPAIPASDGTATPALTQDYYQIGAKPATATPQLNRDLTPRPDLPVANPVLTIFINHWQIAISDHHQFGEIYWLACPYNP